MNLLKATFTLISTETGWLHYNIMIITKDMKDRLYYLY